MIEKDDNDRGNTKTTLGIEKRVRTGAEHENATRGRRRFFYDTKCERAHKRIRMARASSAAGTGRRRGGGTGARAARVGFYFIIILRFFFPSVFFHSRYGFPRPGHRSVFVPAVSRPAVRATPPNGRTVGGADRAGRPAPSGGGRADRPRRGAARPTPVPPPPQFSSTFDAGNDRVACASPSIFVKTIHYHNNSHPIPPSPYCSGNIWVFCLRPHRSVRFARLTPDRLFLFFFRFVRVFDSPETVSRRIRAPVTPPHRPAYASAFCRFRF